MKKYLYINHVGPITSEVRLDLRRFNVFIGPQSSGKSTIAKLISTLFWLEKEACTMQSENILPQGKSFVSLMEDYHRMHNYFSEQSVVRYESDYVLITYIKGEYSLTIKSEAIKYKRVKVSYIPSDRNVITLRDIEKRDLEATNFRSFLFDWLEARRSFDMNQKAQVLELGVNYYFDKEQNQYQDRITHENGQTYNIPLYDASSGLQSVVPLVVLIGYLKDAYYNNYGKEISFAMQKRVDKLLRKLIERYLMPVVPHSEDDTPDDVFHKANEAMINHTANYKPQFDMIQAALYNLNTPNSISYIIEEPEQNLFPSTQCDLVKYIISACNDSEHKSSAVITTHSPYILAMINNQILAGKLKEKRIDEDKISKLLPIDSIIYSQEIGVYGVGYGTCVSILDEQTGLIDQNYLDTASENNAAIFDELYNLYVKALRK